MNTAEMEAVVKNIIGLMNDNAGNRITVVTATGICFLHEQFVKTLVEIEVPRKPAEAVADPEGGKKE